ncbi:low temperature requirement protein A [Macrococcus brunensis]|uniref:low temperature requirement protein A n=1 Tax=Macrococcus brunensis TaxID=198483 RepID=UPI001EF0428D|nr:low temperature requirement protein A [Macrococcus brunensis]ULG71618.1 low temperature requirement protein A [Macrococcus brunensis]ULG73881.1 low temperature requirement protein A [Macrococcus brunensis]
MEEHLFEDLTDRHKQDKKAVDMTELFYDLVFVYAISQISHTILYTEHGDIPLLNFIKYFMMTLVFYTVWSYQTTYTNRFGLIRVKDLFFLLFNMFIAIFLAISLKGDINSVFDPINICIAILFISTSLQFFLALKDKILPYDRFAAKLFGRIMLISACLAIAAIFVTGPLMYVLFVAAILSASLMPMPFRKRIQLSGVNVPHMAERYSLLIIIMFGEAIIGLTEIFDIKHLHFSYPILFITLISLFGAYWLKSNRLIQKENYSSGLTMTIAHFLMIIGLGMINASLVLNAKEPVEDSFEIQLMHAAFAFFYAGMLLTLQYSHEKFTNDRTLRIVIPIILIISFIIAYITRHMAYTLTITGAVTTTIIFFVYLYIYKKKHPDIQKED